VGNAIPDWIDKVSKETEEIVKAANPVPFLKGRFNAFHTPDGGFHISYQKDPTDEEPEPKIEHMTIPGQVVRLAKMLENGDMSPAKAFKMITGMMGGMK
jgi:hypothetical protein